MGRSREQGRAVSVSLFWLSLAIAPRAVAAEAPVALVWNAPAECPAAEEVSARVERLLGERAASVPGPPLEVRVAVSAGTNGGVAAELRTFQAGAARTRRLEAANCRELAEAAAVVIALAVLPPGDTPATSDDADGTKTEADAPAEDSRPPPPPEPRRSSGAAAPSPTDDKARETAPAAKPRSGVELRARSGLALAFGAIAPVAAGFAIAGSGRRGPFELALRGSFFPARRSVLADRPNKGADISLAALALLLCAEPFELPVELGACGEVELGLLFAEGFGTLDHYEQASSWVAPGGALVAAWPRRGRFRIGASLEALFPLAPTRFVLTNAGVARSLPAVTGRSELFFGVIFP